MAQPKLLDTIEIVDEGEMSVIPEATYFILDRGKIRQYKINPSPERWMKEIPRGANTFKFEDYRRWKNNIDYGRIIFYNLWRDILKTRKI